MTDVVKDKYKALKEKATETTVKALETVTEKGLKKAAKEIKKEVAPATGLMGKPEEKK